MSDGITDMHRDLDRLRKYDEEVPGLRSELATVKAERDILRSVLQELCPAGEGFTEDFDLLVDHGLLVEVPADEEFKAEWGDDCSMLTWSWLAGDGEE